MKMKGNKHKQTKDHLQPPTAFCSNITIWTQFSTFTATSVRHLQHMKYMIRYNSQQDSTQK